jgi:hypothetical protein
MRPPQRRLRSGASQEFAAVDSCPGAATFLKAFSHISDGMVAHDPGLPRRALQASEKPGFAMRNALLLAAMLYLESREIKQIDYGQ